MFFIKDLQNKYYLCFISNNQTELQRNSISNLGNNDELQSGSSCKLVDE